MSITSLRNLEKRFLTDTKITADEAKLMLDATKDYGGVSKGEKAELKAMLSRNADKLDPAAKTMIEKFLGLGDITPPTPPANAEVIRAVNGTNKASFEDDTVFLGRDGKVHGESNVPAYTRSYDATKEGPLRNRHGSSVPASSVIKPEDLAAAQKNSPGQALDAAAKAFGVRVDGFEAMANSKDFFNPDADFWWGKCHAWTWSSLSTEIDKLVDVPGPVGERGLWVGGQFMSRADLGNWMMAVADKISVNDGNQLFDSNLSAVDLLKGTQQYLMNNGGGVVADVFNDKKKGHKEVWNQPFVSSDLTTTTLKPEVAKQLIDQATKDGVTGGASVKQVNIVGTYGVEVSDDHEGDPGRSSKSWNMYAVCDANGKVLTAYMADDEKLKTMTNLPTTYTDDVPDYFWKPTLGAVNDTLAGKPNSTVNWNEHGKEFGFFVQTVLKKGVPATTRKAFEADFAALPAGNVAPARAQELAQKYPGVANAYSPDQWRSIFEARGLSSQAFGAAWPS
ncbi:MAG: hypothetical protein U0228_07095 [Myxococcaceae bacterium]